jgi:hypothetical protein
MKCVRRLMSICLAWLALAGSAFSQIPVTDVASLTQQIQQVMAWSQQYQQMVQQYQMMTNQLNAIKGARGMGGLLNIPVSGSSFRMISSGSLTGCETWAPAARTVRRVRFTTR